MDSSVFLCPLLIPDSVDIHIKDCRSSVIQFELALKLIFHFRLDGIEGCTDIKDLI